jgi:hypothetical protein
LRVLCTPSLAVAVGATRELLTGYFIALLVKS